MTGMRVPLESIRCREVQQVHRAIFHEYNECLAKENDNVQ